MTDFDAIRTRAAIADERLGNSLRAARARWNDPIFHQDPGRPRPEERTAWTPRDVAEHALSGEPLNLGVAIRVVRENAAVDILQHMRSLSDFDWSNRSYAWMEFETADDALADLHQRIADREQFLSGISPADLHLAVGMVDGAVLYMEQRNVPIERTVEGLLVFCAEHRLDHADQLASAFA